MLKNLLVLTLASLFLVSCASREAGWEKGEESLTMSKEEMAKTEKMAMKSWKQRHKIGDLKESLELFEKLSKATKDIDKKYEYLVFLSRGHYFLADAHYEDTDMKIKHWEMGTTFGELAMATNDKFAAAMKEGEGVADSLVHLGKREIAAVYWSAVNLGKWGKIQGLTTILKYKTRIKEMVTFVEKMDPRFYEEAAGRYWGVYYAVAPSFAGGDMKASKKYFDATIKKAPNYLATKVLYAKFWCTKSNNPEEFEKTLKSVINTKVKMGPYYPENVIEQKKAKALLAEKEDLF